ncbi:MAG: cobalt-precorrin-4/precorrin-4 C(11)-methyltransferase [Methanomicrobiales archaeon]|nr:cobalt-precorrin-4/precorrin-4 C(11)-methyltransferase [Methanomicrobiales archaeon]
MKKVYFVGAGPGDPGLITVKGMRLLKKADLVVYTGSLVNPALVELSPAPMKMDSHGMRLEEIVRLLVKGAEEGKRVIRLHSGDPSLWGAIVEQISQLVEAGIEVEIVPGVSSMFGAAAALRTQLTLAGVSDTLIVTRPAGKTLESDRIRDLSSPDTTMVIFLGTDRLEEIAGRCSYPPDTPAAVVYHATWPDQKIVRGTLAEIPRLAREAGITRSALLIIGSVVEPDRSGFRRSVLYS